MRLKIVIADDEKEARELLLHYLCGMETAAEVLECADGKATSEALQKFSPDILFLDIRMPELSGIEVLQGKEASSLPAVVFTTAYDDYALPAFEAEAVDYLLKPFEKERFEKAWKRAIAYVEFVRSKKAKAYSSTLAVKTGSRTDLLSLDDVWYFRAEGTYVQVVTELRTYLIPEAIYELEGMLNPQRFLRIHRSVIVNTACVTAIHSLLNGDHLLTLKNGAALRASRTYRDAVKRLQNQ